MAILGIPTHASKNRKRAAAETTDALRASRNYPVNECGNCLCRKQPTEANRSKKKQPIRACTLSSTLHWSLMIIVGKQDAPMCVLMLMASEIIESKPNTRREASWWFASISKRWPPRKGVNYRKCFESSSHTHTLSTLARTVYEMNERFEYN